MQYKPTCPQCGGQLERIKKPSHLNSEQWDSLKAGDYYCKECPGNGRGVSGLCYWNKSEVAEKFVPMDREKAERIVNDKTFMVNQYKAVSHSSVIGLLGERFEILMKDDIRRLGPTSDTVYPWNVVDYLTNECPNKNLRHMLVNDADGK